MSKKANQTAIKPGIQGHTLNIQNRQTTKTERLVFLSSRKRVTSKQGGNGNRHRWFQGIMKIF